MRLRKNDPAPEPATGYVGDHADKLSRVRPIAHDEDERQSTARPQHLPLAACRACSSRCRCRRWLKPRKSKQLL